MCPLGCQYFFTLLLRKSESQQSRYCVVREILPISSDRQHLSYDSRLKDGVDPMGLKPNPLRPIFLPFLQCPIDSVGWVTCPVVRLHLN